ncbi:MAG TPA: STAS domain-containing protein [bacterium]|mgnify:CR=1 FL=1|nr:STAS domain-containing protein [bacterium]HPN44441.1 STAS domain-containing protein [bacterium]
MQIASRLEGKVLVISITGELMAGQDSDHLRNIIDEAIKDEHIEVVADMKGVAWMNSSGLGMLISALTSLRSAGGDLKLANLSDRIRRPMQITKLDTVFQDFTSVQEAVSSYAN